MVLRTVLAASNPVLKSVRPVAEGSRHVERDNDKIAEFARHFKGSEVKHWMEHYRIGLPQLSSEEKLAFLFVFNSISFSYWGSPKWSVPLAGEMPQRGTICMFASLRKAVEERRLVLDANHLADMRKDALSDILKGSTEIPLLDKRCAILREVGQVAATRWNGRFLNILEGASGDAAMLLAIITDMFPSFSDFSILDGNPVFFHKRAQLLVSDIHRVFNGEGPGKLARIHKLTACADYALPMVLRHGGILVYDRHLARMVDGGMELPAGSREEIEIRANTVLAVELIRQELEFRIPVTSMSLNDYLWVAKENLPENVKHHLTRTTAY